MKPDWLRERGDTMPVITLVQKGNFKKTNSFIEKALEFVRLGELDKYGRQGVKALAEATPIDSGETSQSWYYKIERHKSSVSIVWCNSHVENGCNIAVILQYGHGTRNGGWVQGRDYINPAIQPLFDEIADKAWKEVSS
jgi:hypothetical protein